MKKLVFLSLFVGGIAVAPTANGQETKIAVTPAIIDTSVEIGQSVKRTIQIRNGSESALPISVDVQSAVLEGEPLLDTVDRDSRFDVSSWVSFEQETYLFEAGQTRELSFTVTAPFTALAGGHYAQISLRGLTLETEVDADASSLIFPEIGVPLLVTVPGEIVEDVSIKPGNLLPTFVQNNTVQDSQVIVQDNGTVHNLVTASLIIKQDGQVVSKSPIQPSIVLPATEREYSYEWLSPEFGKYEAYYELSFGNTQTMYTTAPETVYVIPPLDNLFVLAIVTWLTCYFYPKRRNIFSAVRVLFSTH